jgi:hypothetical protein
MSAHLRNGMLFLLLAAAASASAAHWGPDLTRRQRLGGVSVVYGLSIGCFLLDLGRNRRHG